MEEAKDSCMNDDRMPDGRFDVKCGRTTYKVKVFFDHQGAMTAEDKLKRVIQEEALKKTG